MKTVIEDTWFPSSTRIRIGTGADELSFVRCAFEGGDIFIEQNVDIRIFSQCTFHGTSFSGQPLSERIAVECHGVPAATEAAAKGPVRSQHPRFR